MSLNSTMNAPFGGESKRGTGGTYDRHETPVINKPRDVGKDAQPEKFFEQMPGHKNGTKLETTFDTAIPMNGGSGGSGASSTTLQSTMDNPLGKK